MPITYPAHDEKPKRVLYVGAVLAEGEHNWHNDSDFFAVVWDGEAVKRVEYATTRFACDSYCRVDATPETIVAASAYLREVLFQAWLEADKRDARTATVGKEVRFNNPRSRPTVKLEDGTRRKVVQGSTGTVMSREEVRSQYNTWHYGYRLGVAMTDERTPGFTLTTVGDEVHLSSPYNPDFPYKARSLGGKWNRSDKVWAFPADREDDVRKLAGEFYQGRYKEVCWTDAKNVEVVDPEQHETPLDQGREWAARNGTAWVSATDKTSLKYL
jgi:hypothetical protein